jgi:hypothetical protein
MTYYFPAQAVAEARSQLKDHRSVLIDCVATRFGANAVTAALDNACASFTGKVKKGLALEEPVGTCELDFEPPAPGDPDTVMEEYLRGLVPAFGYSVDYFSRAAEKGKNVKSMIDALIGDLKQRVREHKRRPYCVVARLEGVKDRENQLRTLAKIREHVPDLLFVEIFPHSESMKYETYAIRCLNTRFATLKKRKLG